MSEIEKMYENAGIEPKYSGWLDMGDLDTQMTYIQCDTKEEWDECVFMSRSSYSSDDEDYDKPRMEYPPFTAEKQIEIENVILQNKKTYNKWIEYNINVYGEWVIRFVRTDKFAPYIALEKTRAEAFANVINHFWQDLTEEEKQQVKGILE